MPALTRVEVEDIIIRNYQKKDEAAIEDITYRTGFKGEDLTGRGFFDDKRLWFLIFIYYYPRYEPQHCFVAVDITSARSNAVVGFVCGTTDTTAQQAQFQRKVVFRIALRAFLFTIWRYPRTFKTLVGYLRMARHLDDNESNATIEAQYPAHLHIDLLPEYQSQGIGSRLMQHFERHMIEQNVRGIHLRTTSRNRKAVPFYKKMGYTIIHESRVKSHPAPDDLVLLTFAKRLSR